MIWEWLHKQDTDRSCLVHMFVHDRNCKNTSGNESLELSCDRKQLQRVRDRIKKY